MQYAINKGVVVVFSAGNTARHSMGDNGTVLFPANSNMSSLIVVGASDRYDKQADYSPTSSFIDIVAPSHRAYPSSISGETLEMWALDIPDNLGDNPWPSTNTHPPMTGSVLPDNGTNYLAYTGRAGGTSFACPVVAGVAALVLSVNPYLTPQQVYDILTETADKIGGYSYMNNKCYQTGFGRVNAYEAVKMVLCALPASTLSKTITTDETINSSILQIYNTTVKQNKKLTVNACEEVNINANFEVETGAEFEINITP